MKTSEEPATSSLTTVNDSTVVTSIITKRSCGVQVSFIRIEHHRIVETVKEFKEEDTEVTSKEAHETKWADKTAFFGPI